MEEERPAKVDSNDISSALGFEGGRQAIEQVAKKSPNVISSYIKPVKGLQQTHPKMREQVIEGLLRRGEIMNCIAAAKEGKSHLMADLIQSLVIGSTWLGFKLKRGRGLIIDNELHEETIAERNRSIYLARNWAEGSNGEFPEPDGFDYAPIRGKLIDIEKLWEEILGSVPRGYYDIVVLDAFYKFYPKGMKENDNADMTRMYTIIDSYAEKMDACFILVHHPTKGEQGTKNILDVGAGAGAATRATDTHLILRPNPHNSKIVIEFKSRTFPSLPAKEATYTYPVFNVEREMTPDELEKTKPQPKDKKREFGVEDLVKLFTGKPMTKNELLLASESFQPKPTKARFNMIFDNSITQKKVMKSGKDQYEKMPEIVPDVEDAQIEECEVIMPPGDDE